ncbi:4-hydroxy-tetrahydrodipicolinate synthase [Salinicoccus roseus]|jgi:4-hydroxy-tetrahydrodipicolinate synthase|uniref:4-hydroxy-tetrahydrodipicolinate synthase n=1 Tax=Salinicoccus roseus TaxID=45670 RepID=A0A265E8Q6_9STAP|nr:4-hydroxy-tetrahydrodipicolinate synthase [Salinicoccus roseus]OZT77974.1 4-hydroxy-tetrahydrodipicolinate synthase [Salinicoccus roseus]RPE54034.1 dihydrodipicolinate synthase [Salinicoccus roseus]GGA68841.1 4-hydroxy-tetrahydrodipicolinate synthase [Salinicoccus roseus]
MDSDIIFEGIGVAITTPLTNDEVDYAAFRKHIEYLIDNNVQAIIVNGTTGESPTLSSDEARELLKVGVDTVAGRVPVIAGTGTNSTRASIELSKYAAEIGADALMLITPYYNKSNQSGLYQHFTKIADSTELPVVLYNVPGRTGMTIEPDTVAELSRHPHIVALKDAVGDLEYTKEVLELTSDQNFILYSGNDDNMHDFCQLGGKGLISVVGNIIPGELQEVYESIKNGSGDSQEKFDALMPMIKAVQVDVNPIPVKAMTSELGFGNYELRLPLVPLEEEALNEVIQTMRKFKEGSFV